MFFFSPRLPEGWECLISHFTFTQYSWVSTVFKFLSTTAVFILEFLTANQPSASPALNPATVVFLSVSYINPLRRLAITGGLWHFLCTAKVFRLLWRGWLSTYVSSQPLRPLHSEWARRQRIKKSTAGFFFFLLSKVSGTSASAYPIKSL